MYQKYLVGLCRSRAKTEYKERVKSAMAIIKNQMMIIISKDRFYADMFLPLILNAG